MTDEGRGRTNEFDRRVRDVLNDGCPLCGAHRAAHRPGRAWACPLDRTTLKAWTDAVRVQVYERPTTDDAGSDWKRHHFIDCPRRVMDDPFYADFCDCSQRKIEGGEQPEPLSDVSSPKITAVPPGRPEL